MLAPNAWPVMADAAEDLGEDFEWCKKIVEPPLLLGAEHISHSRITISVII
jgi:hypothetical protein